MIRKSFNNDWKFSRGSGSALSAMFGGQEEPEAVTLPHDASILEPRVQDPYASGNAYFTEGNYHYTRKFCPDACDSDKIFLLFFEGVYQNAFVYVNHSFAAKHPYGYGEFYIDITKYLRFGEENEISVVVKNGVSSGRWYTGGGIYRDVTLLVADRLYLAPQGTQIETVETDEELAVIRVKTTLIHRNAGNRTVRLVTELYDENGVLAASDNIPVTIQEQESLELEQKLYVRQPKCWSAEQPSLYRYQIRILEDARVSGTERNANAKNDRFSKENQNPDKEERRFIGEQILDEETGTFGIRTIQVDPLRGLRINGKTVKLRGGCIHHDNGLIGSAEFSHAEQVRIRELKKAGYNAIRSAHYPMSRQLLKACDELGMYVMDEFSDVWTTTKVDFDYGMNLTEWWKYDIEHMVYKDFNHPCVILYSIGNEIPEVGNCFDARLGKRMADKIRQMDRTRPLVNCMNLTLAVMDRFSEVLAAIGSEENLSAGEINSLMTNLGAAMEKITGSDYVAAVTEEACSHVDVTGFNYAAARYEIDGNKFPNRVIVGSETNPRDLDRNWALVEKLPYVIGDFSWTAWDYLGEAGIALVTYENEAMGFYKPYPCKAAYCGDFNLLGDRRPVSYWREIIWGLRKKPYLAVQPPQHYGEKKNMTQWAFTDAVHTWTWKESEGKPVCVEVYSTEEEVELFINGSSIGRKKTGELKKGVTYFDTVYNSGTIEAVAFSGGKETGRDVLKTAGDTLRLSVKTDQDGIPADGADICYVDLRIEDENGELHTEAEIPVTVALDGPGQILGFGSAAPVSAENYYDRTAITFEGRLRAAIRAEAEGTIRVIFKAEGLEPAAVEIQTK